MTLGLSGFNFTNDVLFKSTKTHKQNFVNNLISL